MSGAAIPVIEIQGCPLCETTEEGVRCSGACEQDLTCPDCGQGPYDCECHVGADCGRWRNGHLSSICSKAGSEECDFECPHRNSLYRRDASDVREDGNG